MPPHHSILLGIEIVKFAVKSVAPPPPHHVKTLNFAVKKSLAPPTPCEDLSLNFVTYLDNSAETLPAVTVTTELAVDHVENSDDVTDFMFDVNMNVSLKSMNKLVERKLL